MKDGADLQARLDVEMHDPCLLLLLTGLVSVAGAKHSEKGGKFRDFFNASCGNRGRNLRRALSHKIGRVGQGGGVVPFSRPYPHTHLKIRLVVSPER
jgi:hypothetical protein